MVLSAIFIIVTIMRAFSRNLLLGAVNPDIRSTSGFGIILEYYYVIKKAPKFFLAKYQLYIKKL
jgi:hypothetical protein